MLTGFSEMQKNLQQQKEALELGVSESEIEAFMSYQKDERERIINHLKYLKETGKDRL
jgi:predicted XRE-type DNA-binding protein